MVLFVSSDKYKNGIFKCVMTAISNIYLLIRHNYLSESFDFL